MNELKARDLFIDMDEKNTRTVNIINALLNGETPIAVARKHRLSRQAVTNIRTKYIKAPCK